MAEKVRAHILISGLVQGVFFRQNTKEKARGLGVKGWVRNALDGKVEAVFEGEKEKVKEILNWAKKGPPLARVDGINVEWEEYKGEFKNFETRHD